MLSFVGRRGGRRSASGRAHVARQVGRVIDARRPVGCGQRPSALHARGPWSRRASGGRARTDRDEVPCPGGTKALSGGRSAGARLQGATTKERDMRPHENEHEPRAPSAAMTFLGAVGTVTGSRFLRGDRIDQVPGRCGPLPGPRLRPPPQLATRSRWIRRTLDHVVLTHAHLDHTGYLPRLVKDGFRGRVTCTRDTAELAAIVLRDSAHLQEEDAAYANDAGFSRHHPALPLYDHHDVERTLRLFAPVGFDADGRAGPGCRRHTRVRRATSWARRPSRSASGSTARALQRRPRTCTPPAAAPARRPAGGRHGRGRVDLRGPQPPARRPRRPGRRHLSDGRDAAAASSSRPSPSTAPSWSCSSSVG